ncbi:MAG: molybdopterin-binding protein [Synergistaceae bacterium]|jgi:molybdopterin biosynthesis enzyme MoaB|nr:molybdopterin-binding protein [Synergistaceae bacterium]
MRREDIGLEEAVGRPLAHDMTRIDAKKGTKGARFKRGQVLTVEDLPVLREMGKEHVSILELSPGEVHEDDAAGALCEALAGENCASSSPKEGRITITAGCDGLLIYDPAMVHAINEDPDWVLATMPPYRQVGKGQPVAGFRIVPLAMEGARVERAVSAARRIDIKPFKPLRVGLVTTGLELATGLIEDAFADKFLRKISVFGGTLIGQRLVTDDPVLIAEAISAFIDDGAEAVVCTGGMSVDADDRTPGGIMRVASRVAFQGVPILPGSMLMLAWAASLSRGEIALIGAPACVVHDERTSLDWLLPFIFAGEDSTPFVRRRGVGGLCERCSPCRWPSCSFSGAC